jgi:hypothetical protein
MENIYYNKYLKYKNKYVSLKNNINIQHGGAGRVVIKLRMSICDQVTDMMSYLDNVLLDQQQSRLWNGTDFYHVFGNINAIYKLGVEQLGYMISSISNKFEDPSYSAKVGLIKAGVDKINMLQDSLKRITSSYKIHTIADIAELKHYCNSDRAPKNFRTHIEVHEVDRDRERESGGYIGSNSYPTFGVPPSGGSSGGPFGSTGGPSGSSGGPYSSIDGRCVYRDPKCIGDKDIITFEYIDKTNINNVVRVDKKCYDADELQKWLVNNQTLPHNRQKYTSKSLNKCVEGGTNIPNPSSPLNPYVPPISNSYIDPYALTDPYAPTVPTSHYAPTSPYGQTSPIGSYTTPIIINAKRDDSSSEDNDESSSDKIEVGSITKIEIHPVKGKKITYTKNGRFMLKEGKKNKDIQFKLEIRVDNKKSYFIQTETKKKDVINLFYNEEDTSKNGSYKVKEIKSITIEDADKKVKINYNTKPVKKLLQEINKIIKSVSHDSNGEDLSF